jgi:hypothetical protein
VRVRVHTEGGRMLGGGGVVTVSIVCSSWTSVLCVTSGVDPDPVGSAPVYQIQIGIDIRFRIYIYFNQM